MGSWISKQLGPYGKSVSAVVGYAIAFVVAQEQLQHPFTGNWWVGLLTGIGLVLGVFGVPNSPKSPAPVAAPAPAATPGTAPVAATPATPARVSDPPVASGPLPS